MQKPPTYSHVVEVTGPGRTVYFAGQLGIDKSGKISANAREQVEIAFENVKAALAFLLAPRPTAITLILSKDTQNETIERIQVRRPPPRAAADDQLVLQQQGFSQASTYSARAQALGNGGQQVDGEYEQVNHRPERSHMSTSHKTAHAATFLRGLRIRHEQAPEVIFFDPTVKVGSLFTHTDLVRH